MALVFDNSTGTISANGGQLVLAAGGQIEAGSQFKVLDGSVTQPSITNYGDENTGLYFPAQEMVALVGQGIELLKVDGTTKKVTISGAYSLPVNTGTSGQVITSDGAGGSTWATPASGGGSGGGVSRDEALLLAMIFGG